MSDAPCIQFKTRSRRPEIVPPVASGRFAFLEMQDRAALRVRDRLDREVLARESRKQWDRACRVVAGFVPEYRVQLAAMVLVDLKREQPFRSSFSRVEVLGRMREAYDIEEEGS